ncbi:MAG: anti-sigma F factor [Lachnospiraceae bacterium]|nr:anti-sigma F factor [Lachnospiraceae bacterium]MBQ4067794.1 anti-sigma F factor [Lachnospiraceae bacterium]
MYSNKIHLEFDAKSINEGFARVVAAALATQLNPTIDEVNDIKTAVSEAVTNAIIHGYNGQGGVIYMDMEIDEEGIIIIVEDKGIGIDDLKQAMEPLFTTKGTEERSGMGFAFMEMFMDELNVESEKGVGTKVYMKKYINWKN